MPSFASLVALAAPLMVLAAPTPMKRDAATDLLVVQFATVLENFESEFYQQALQKFQASDFIAAGFVDANLPVEQFTQIQSDEATHQIALESVIQADGSSPIAGCQFDFGDALNDVTTMAATARVVEQLGVGAYLGAAHLVSDPTILTAAASILTVEARHQTILNVLNGGSSIPSAFDIALSPSETLAIAGAFISQCDLNITANQPLTVTNTGTVQPGTLLTFDVPGLNSSVADPHCQMLLGGASSSISLALSNCTVPDGINGPVAIWVTADQQPLNGDVVNRANQSILAGPTLVFIDIEVQVLSQIVLAGSSDSGNSGSVTTSTISPSDASSIISSATVSSASSAQSTETAIATPTEVDKTQVTAPSTRNIATGNFGAITIDGWQDLISQ